MFRDVSRRCETYLATFRDISRCLEMSRNTLALAARVCVCVCLRGVKTTRDVSKGLETYRDLSRCHPLSQSFSNNKVSTHLEMSRNISRYILMCCRTSRDLSQRLVTSRDVVRYGESDFRTLTFIFVHDGQS